MNRDIRKLKERATNGTVGARTLVSCICLAYTFALTLSALSLISYVYALCQLGRSPPVKGEKGTA